MHVCCCIWCNVSFTCCAGLSCYLFHHHHMGALLNLVTQCLHHLQVLRVSKGVSTPGEVVVSPQCKWLTGGGVGREWQLSTCYIPNHALEDPLQFGVHLEVYQIGLSDYTLHSQCELAAGQCHKAPSELMLQYIKFAIYIPHVYIWRSTHIPSGDWQENVLLNW